MVTVQLSPGAGPPKVSGPILKSFNEIKDFEKRLPQHRLTTTPETGFNGRVFLAWNEMWGLGLNNQLDNRLMLSHLSFLANRSYVFNDVMFGEHWDSGVWHPLNTFISGPTAGGPLPPALEAFSIPRAIRRDIWEKHCPLERRIILNVHDVNEELGLHKNSEGREILERWAEKLREMPDECVELGPHEKHIFDFDLWGTSRILSLYPSFATSPIMTSFRFSNVVLNAVERNTPVVTGISELDHSSAGNAYSTTLAIHVRRGDFDEHCINMATWAPGYNSWNLIPSLRDKYSRPPLDLNAPEHKELLDEFMRHCWPDMQDIVERVKDIKVQYEIQGGKIDGIYVMTNGKDPWLGELKSILITGVSGIKRVMASRDITLETPPEKLASQAVDMEVAARAGLFLGNGFSSMSANIVLLRLLRGLAADTCRLW
ncbi:hypothetical protein M422DRAFT_150501 [Sphaerobolus stellatus SS14]|nr:hypothetical protein M422DRAFT_150501 [Sphaerobolus stellatus SS14]